MTHLIAGCCERTSRQISTPLPSDNRTSSTATSGSARGILDRASTAEPASPPTSMPPAASSRLLRPRRTTSWSSRTNTRVITHPPLWGLRVALIASTRRCQQGLNQLANHDGTESIIPTQAERADEQPAQGRGPNGGRLISSGTASSTTARSFEPGSVVLALCCYQRQAVAAVAPRRAKAQLRLLR